MTEDEKKILREVMLKKRYNLIIEKIPYERRKILIGSVGIIMEVISEENEIVLLNDDVDNFCAAFLTSEEAIKLLNEINDDDYKENLLYCINDDDVKIDMLKSSNVNKYRILASISTDNKLFEAIDKLTDKEKKYMYFSFIRYFKEDKNKILYVERNNINSKSEIESLIESLNDVNLKYYVFNKYISGKYPRYEKHSLYKLIKSIKDSKIKIDKLNGFIDEYCKNKVDIYIDLSNSIVRRERKADVITLVKDIVPKLDDKYKLEIIILYKKLKDVGENVPFKLIEDVIKSIDVFNNDKKYKDIYDYILSNYKENYKNIINSNNLEMFVNKFGYEVLKFLDNKNIQKIINLDSVNFNKFLNIFSRKNIELNNDLVNSIYNACIQREFRLKNIDDYNIFGNIKEAINRKDNERLLELLHKIDVDNDLFKNIDDVCKVLISGKNINLLLSKLNDLTNLYLTKRREEYINERSKEYFNELNFDKRYEKNSALKYFLSHMSFDDVDSFVNLMQGVDINKIDSNLEYLINDRDTLIKIMRFKINPKKERYDGDKKNIKEISKILNYMYNNNMISLPDGLSLPLEYYPKKVSMSCFLNVFTDINIDNLVNKIFNNEETYILLIEYLSKYKFLGYGDTFEKIFKKCDLEYSDDTIIGLISYFDKVIEKIDNNDKKNELLAILDWSNSYSSLSSSYGMLLGIDNLGYIKSNPNPNSSTLSVEERLAKAVEFVEEMYMRKEITVPPINRNISLKSGLDISITLGEVTDMTNLTLGERTGACARIGGAGKGLFNFCIENKNGFNVIFRNPSNNNFVTRVSGFRNGNTVFLNQLRFSVDKRYSNDDIIEACKWVADEIISSTKDSEYPISNVVISASQVLDDYDEEVDLNINNPTENFGYFTTDVGDSPIVLATSAKSGKFVPCDFSQTGIPLYDPIRGQIRKITDKFEILSQINKIKIIDHILNKKDINDFKVITDDYIENVAYLVSGDDYYIAFDSNNHIAFEFVIEERVNDIRTRKEIDEVKKIFAINEKEDMKAVKL